MDLSKEYDQAIKALFRLRTYNEDEIDKIYINLRSKLLETKIMMPSEMMGLIFTAAKLNNRYIKSYLSIFRKVYDEYINIIRFYPKTMLFTYDNEYYSDFKQFKDMMHEQNQFIFGQEENTIYKAVFDDNINLFISLIERFNIDVNKLIQNDFSQILIQSIC